jgi:hypothetical protein
MDEELDIEKWRREWPMDYIKGLNLINSFPNFRKNVFSKVIEIARLHVPDILFKYCSLSDDSFLNDEKIKTLKEKRIYLSTVEGLNDPFECKAYYYKLDRITGPYDAIMKRIPEFGRIASFTSNGSNSMPMWAHYANNHKGFCVSYNLKDKRNFNLSACTFPVQYVSKRIDITDFLEQQFGEIQEAIQKALYQEKKEVLFDDLSLIYMTILFSNIKLETWKYEKEFRCLAGATAKGIPYFLAVPEEIYIGMDCPECYSEKLVKTAKILKISAYKMFLDEKNEEYSLSYKKLI